MDCVKFKLLIKLRMLIKCVEILFAGIALFISSLGVFGIYVLNNEHGTWQMVATNFIVELPSGLEVGWIWWLLGAIVLVTAVDWLCNVTKFDCVEKD